MLHAKQPWEGYGVASLPNGWLPLFPKSLKNREKHVASIAGKSCLRSTKKKIKENESLNNSLGNISNSLNAFSG